MKEIYKAMLTTADNPMISEKIEYKGNIIGNLTIKKAVGQCLFETVEQKVGDQTTPCSDLILLNNCGEIRVDEDKIICTDTDGTWIFEIIK